MIRIHLKIADGSLDKDWVARADARRPLRGKKGEHRSVEGVKLLARLPPCPKAVSALIAEAAGCLNLLVKRGELRGVFADGFMFIHMGWLATPNEPKLSDSGGTARGVRKHGS